VLARVLPAKVVEEGWVGGEGVSVCVWWGGGAIACALSVEGIRSTCNAWACALTTAAAWLCCGLECCRHTSQAAAAACPARPHTLCVE
jgi:hypothetical protein